MENSLELAVANKLLAVFVHWAVAFITWAVYQTADYCRSLRSGRQYDLGVVGFRIGLAIIAMITIVDAVIYAVVLGYSDPVSETSSLALYLVSSLAGLIAPFAILGTNWLISIFEDMLNSNLRHAIKTIFDQNFPVYICIVALASLVIFNVVVVKLAFGTGAIEASRITSAELPEHEPK